MKKIILSIIFILSSITINAINIDYLDVSPVSNQDVNVHLIVKDNVVIQYSDYTYSIIGNTVTLYVCYFKTILQSLSTVDKNFLLPINSGVNNYTLVVNVYESLPQQICDYSTLSDTASISFSTPLIQAIVLSTNNFENQKNNFVYYPNPTRGLVNINFGQQQENVTITLTDVLGQIVSSKKYSQIENTTYNIVGERAVYFLTIENKNGVKKTIKVIKQ